MMHLVAVLAVTLTFTVSQLEAAPVDPPYFMDISNVTLARSSQVEDRATSQCGCGQVPALAAAGRIVGGKVVNPKHSRPYQLYLQACKAPGSSCWSCGATLVNRRYAVTAAHCVSTAATATHLVAAGEHDVQADVETKKAQAIKVTVIAHPQYNKDTIDNDIAILKLEKDITFNSNVVPACLPTDKSKTYAGQTAVVSGWGATSFQGPGSSVLKETTLKILADSDPICIKGANEIGKWAGKVAPGKLCAYKKGTDSCQGDSGGPLVLSEDGRMTLAGVVSYGDGCAKVGSAGVYARVTYYLDWINANIKDGWCGSTTATTTTASSSSSTTAAGTTTTTAESTTGQSSTDDLYYYYG